MTPPAVRVNTFVHPSNEFYVDVITKIFIIIEIPLGIIRLPLLGNVRKVYTNLFFIYALILTCFIIGVLHQITLTGLLFINIILASFHYAFFIIFNFIAFNRLMLYYNELNILDTESCRPNIGKESKRNLVQMIIMIVYIVALCVVTYLSKNDEERITFMHFGLIPGIVVHNLELFYIGHLLSLLTPRLGLINYHMELSLCNRKPNASNVKYFENNNKFLHKMEKLMSLYHRIVQAYVYLYDAIKWQLFVTLVITFISTLCVCYEVSLNMLRGNGTLTQMLLFVFYGVGTLLPVFAPCIQGDKLHSEVGRLRELLASRIYENKLDKCSRVVARALLSWTETRDLSFSLLRMFNVDISLPFKFLGLLVTYLIILLQFEKVINP